MDDLITLDGYHRVQSPNTPNEYELVNASQTLRGYKARAVAGGTLAVRAYPDRANGKPGAYSFGTNTPASPRYGFKDRKPVVREVRWRLDMEGVHCDKDDNGDEFAYIRITWVER